jgi:hypothetical protein
MSSLVAYATVAVCMVSAVAAPLAQSPSGLYGEYRCAVRIKCVQGAAGHRVVWTRSSDTAHVEPWATKDGAT